MNGRQSPSKGRHAKAVIVVYGLLLLCLGLPACFESHLPAAEILQWGLIAAGILTVILFSLIVSNMRLKKTHNRLAEEITQLKTVKEAAENANLAKSIFLANMSHELRTPLNAILGFSNLLSKSPNLDTEEKRNMEIIRSSGIHLLNLINDVLDISKIEAGRAVINETIVNVQGVLKEIYDMFCLAAGKKGLHLTVACETAVPPYIRTDERKLRQILVNLVGNAIKFTATGAIVLRVDCAVASAGNADRIRMQFEIEDSGEGIAAEELDGLFDAFVQTGTGRKSQEGTGLGLAISRRFVQILGGDIRVQSKIGRGTTFSFDILTREATRDAETGFTNRDKAPSSKGKAPARQLSENLSPPFLSGLPAELMRDLKRAVIEGDYDEIMTLITQVGVHDKHTAENLTVMAENFHYTEILAWIAEGVPKE